MTSEKNKEETIETAAKDLKKLANERKAILETLTTEELRQEDIISKNYEMAMEDSMQTLSKMIREVLRYKTVDHKTLEEFGEKCSAMNEALSQANRKLRDLMGEAFKEASASFAELQRVYADLNSKVNEFKNSDVFKALKDEYPIIQDKHAAAILQMDIGEPLLTYSAEIKRLIAEEEKTSRHQLTFEDLCLTPAGDPQEGISVLESFITSAQNKPKPETILSRFPSSHIYPKDKISNNTFKGVDNPLYAIDQSLIALEKRGSKKELTAAVSLNYDELKGEEIDAIKELGKYDRCVHDAIITLYIEGRNEIVTPGMICKAMTGNPAAKLTAKQEAAINDSIIKLMYTGLTIKAPGYEYNGHVIPGEFVRVMVNGSPEQSGLHIFREPPLYTFASQRNQIGRIDMALLNSPVNKDKQTILLQEYLKDRIITMKHSATSRIIRYETIYETMKIAEDDKKAKSKIREKIRKILDFWTDKGFISSYKEEKKGKDYFRIKIDI